MRIYQLIIFISVAQLILFSSHWFFYKTLVRFFALSNPAILLALKISLILLSLGLVLSTLMVSRYFNFLTHAIYTASASWLGFFYYLILAAIFLWLLWAANQIFSFALNMKLTAILLFGAALAIGLYGIFAAFNIHVTKISVKLPNLPLAWQDKTAVWVSDTHLGQVHNIGFAQKIASLVQAQKPDIVFIGGDFFDGVKSDINALVNPFSKISAPKGIYFITGNHEEFGDRQPYLDAIKNAGIKTLLNEKIEIDGLQILGVDDRDSLNAERFTQILQSFKINSDKPSILLKHSPFDIDTAKNAGISLQLSGHTHLGQLFPNSIITYFVYRGFDYGLRQAGDMAVFVSSGAGTWGPPLRVGAPPEIVVVKFE